MRGRPVVLGVAALAAAAAVAAAVTAVGRSGPPPLRVGVIADCYGFFRGYEDQELAGAELPFLERGAHLRSADLADGVSDATLPGGRSVRLLIACDEGGEFTTVIAAARRLVEEEHADVVVGGTWVGDGIVLGQVARRHPKAVFVAAMTGPLEVTTRRPSPNLFRVRPSYAQQAAGLGTYAYHRLGWRRTAVLVEDDETGWDESAAFTAEFCAAGGAVEQRLGFPLALTRRDARQLAGRVDGVAVFALGFTDPAVLLPTLRTAFGGKRLIVGRGISSDPRAAGRLRDVVTPAVVPAPGEALAPRLHAAFPDLPTRAALSGIGFTVDFDTSVEAVLQAAAQGDDLRSALAHLSLRVPGGSLRIGADGQATVPQTLVRYTAGDPQVVARLAAVPPLLGGLLSHSEQPSAAGHPCRRAATPAYARSLVSRR